MCGFVAFIGEESCARALVEGLRRLAYRGYDAAGLAVHTGRGGIETLRAEGDLSRLTAALERRPLPGTTGIAETRWATHAALNERSTHPHTAGPVAVVHEGIIENHAVLRREIEARGQVFSSETGAEIIAHLVALALTDGAPTLMSAVRRALARVHGTYAIAVLSSDEPDEIVVAKNDSPLVVGRSEDGSAMLAASDVAGILGRTRDVVFLEDGELAVLRKDHLVIRRIVDGTVVVRAPKRIDWSNAEAQRGGFSHVVLKEIHEQPRAAAQTLRGRIDRGQADVGFEGLGLSDEDARAIHRVCLFGCGSSAHAAMLARHWIQELACVPCIAEVASELRHRGRGVGPDDLVIALSQSGETVDTLAAVNAARGAGAKTLALTNVQGSAIARAAGGTLYTHAGRQLGAVPTKTFMTQLVALLLFTVWLGRRRETLTRDRARGILDALHRLPAQLRELVGESARVEAVARSIVTARRDVFVLDRGVRVPMTLGEDDVPLVHACAKTSSNIPDARARGARVVVVAAHGDAHSESLADETIFVPEAHEAVLPLLAVVPLQLLAFHLAVLDGKDVDQPR